MLGRTHRAATSSCCKLAASHKPQDSPSSPSPPSHTEGTGWHLAATGSLFPAWAAGFWALVKGCGVAALPRASVASLGSNEQPGVNHVLLLRPGWAGSLRYRVVALLQRSYRGQGQGTMAAPAWQSGSQHLPTYDVCRCRSLGPARPSMLP